MLWRTVMAELRPDENALSDIIVELPRPDGAHGQGVFSFVSSSLPARTGRAETCVQASFGKISGFRERRIAQTIPGSRRRRLAWADVVPRRPPGASWRSAGGVVHGDRRKGTMVHGIGAGFKSRPPIRP